MSEDEILELKQFLRENLSLNVETRSEYCGMEDSGRMYKDTHTIQLILDGEVISEEYLS